MSVDSLFVQERMMGGRDTVGQRAIVNNVFRGRASAASAVFPGSR